eukprot:7236827-Ditylum_brightwellii.AAC.1
MQKESCICSSKSCMSCSRSRISGWMLSICTALSIWDQTPSRRTPAVSLVEEAINNTDNKSTGK